MNVELIKLSRKAAREWTGTDGYSQASQLINMLCDELEAIAPEQPMEPKESLPIYCEAHLPGVPQVRGREGAGSSGR